MHSPGIRRQWTLRLSRCPAAGGPLTTPKFTLILSLFAALAAAEAATIGDDPGPAADADQEVVIESLAALQNFEYPQAVPHIVAHSQGTDLDVAARAAGTLRRMGRAAEAKHALDRVAVGLSSYDALERINAIGRVRRVGGEHAIQYLEHVLQNDDNVTVRMEAQRALERLRR